MSLAKTDLHDQTEAPEANTVEVEAEVMQGDFEDFVRGENNKQRAGNYAQPFVGAKEFKPNDSRFVDGHLIFGTTNAEREERKRAGAFFQSYQSMIPAMTLDRATSLIQETRSIFFRKGLIAGFVAGIITCAAMSKCSRSDSQSEKETVPKKESIAGQMAQE